MAKKKAKRAARPRKATNTERGRASTLRAKRRAGQRLTKKQDTFLRRYDRDRRAFAKAPTRTRERRAAESVARALVPLVSDRVTDVRLMRTPGAVEVRVKPSAPDLEGDVPIRMPKVTGDAVSIRVQLDTGPKAGDWVTVVAATKKWRQVPANFEAELSNILERYKAKRIRAVSTIAFKPGKGTRVG